MSPTGWHEYQLGHICRFQAGSAFPQKHQGMAEGDLPFIKVSDMNLSGNEVRVTRSNNWVTHELCRELRGKPLPAETPVFAKIGEALKHNRVRLLARPTIVDNNMMGAIPEPEVLNGRFFYYLLSQIGLPGLATGTSVPYLTVSVLSRVIVKLPPLATQRRIASILSAYDDLIENNTRRISILEEMARRLYEEWIVHFRFPGHEEADYEGEVPSGWRRGKLSDLAETAGRSMNPSERPSTLYAHYSFPAFDAGASPQVQNGEEIMSNKLAFSPPAVLLAKLNPRIERVWPVLEQQEHQQICSTEFIPLVPREGSSTSIIETVVRSRGFREHLMGVAGGTSTSHQRVKPKDALAAPVMIPPLDLLNHANSLLDPIQKQREMLKKKNFNLRAQRDLLLPKLVSGEINMSKAEEAMQEVAA